MRANLLLCYIYISAINAYHPLTMGIKESLKSIVTTVTPGFIKNRFNRSNRSDDELKKGIAKFYDESSSIWLRVWGENMHHGYYPNKDTIDHKKAQIDMIDKSLEWAYQSTSGDILVSNMVDVGCGVGGSTRHISRVYNCTGNGISLSPFQISVAKRLTNEINLSDKLDFLVADALNMPFADESFDLTWSMESGEHMPDKNQFMKELVRVTAPGGRIIIVTWCHRELLPNENGLSANEKRLLDKINRAYYLPDWVPTSRYVELAMQLGLDDIRSEDWSQFVEPFWPAVIRSALVPRNIIGLLRAGKTTLRGAIATLYMMQGFSKGIIKFAVITGRKRS